MIRRLLLRVALRLVVIDPELGVLLRQNIGDTLHRGERLPLLVFIAGTRRLSQLSLK